MVPVSYDGPNIVHILFCVNSKSHLYCQISRGSDGEEFPARSHERGAHERPASDFEAAAVDQAHPDHNQFGQFSASYQKISTQTNILNPSYAVKKCEYVGA